MTARKRFGQHFLHDPQVIDRILAVFQPRPGQRVVEIGPGRGALTWPLLQALGELDVIELDRDLAATLPDRCHAQAQHLRIHCADALRFDFHTLAPPGARLRIIGNLPYNISTPLLFHLLAQADVIADMLFMLQKEVVDRITAAPGSKAYGRLSVMVQFLCNAETLFTIGPGAFQPPPKVDSAMLRLVPRRQPLYPVDPDRLARVVTLAFGQRRKTLRNALTGLLSAEQILATGIDPGRRAETLSLEEFARLAELPR